MTAISLKFATPKSMNQIGQAVGDLFLNEMGSKSLVALKNYATPYLLGAAGMFFVSRIPVLGPMLMGAMGPELYSGGVGAALGGFSNWWGKGASIFSSTEMSSQINGVKKDLVLGVDKSAKLINDIQEYLGQGMKTIKPVQDSDLILRSADGTKQIRFDISDPHGLEPHVNIEAYEPRNLFPGDMRMIRKRSVNTMPG